MSDIIFNNSISQSSTSNVSTAKAPIQAPKPSKQASPGAANDTKAPEASSNTESKKDIVTEEYGKVVSVSDDGDTLRVKNEQNQEGIHDILQEEIAELEEMESFEMPDFDVHRVESKATEASTIEDEISEDITSYVGYSDSELKRLYLKGDISQIDYNQEMEAREARREAEASESADFANSVSDSISRLASIDRDANTVNTIANGDTSNTIPDNVRIQALQSLQNFDTV